MAIKGNEKSNITMYDRWLLREAIAELDATAGDKPENETQAKVRTWDGDALTDIQRATLHLYLFGDVEPVFARWTPQIGDKVYISRAGAETLGTVARIENGEFWGRLANGNQRKCSAFQLLRVNDEPAAQPEEPISPPTAATGPHIIQPGETVIIDGDALTLRVDTENGHIYLDNADGAPRIAMTPESTHRYGFILSNELLTQVEAAITARNARYAEERTRYRLIPDTEHKPGFVWPGKRFTFEGRDYEMPWSGDFEKQIGLPYDQVTISTKDVTPGMPIPILRSWRTLEEFTRATNLYTAQVQGLTNQMSSERRTPTAPMPLTQEPPMKAYKCSAGLVCLHRTESGVILIAHYAGQHEQPRVINGALCWSRTIPHIIRRMAERAWRQKLALECRKASRS